MVSLLTWAGWLVNLISDIFVAGPSVEQILLFDRQLFRLINIQMAHKASDQLMRLWSAEWPWYLLLAYFIYLACKKRDWKHLGEVLWIGLTIGISDMVAYFALKPWFGRIRPCRGEDIVRVVDGCGGMYGFPSNHASNAAVFATMWFCLHSPRQGGIAIACGLMVGLSRVYLGVHYPGDILAGYLYGFCLGLLSLFVGHRLQQFWRQKISSATL